VAVRASRAWWTSIAIAVSIASAASAPAGARADDEPAAERSEAQLAFAAGEAAFAEDDYAVALEHFRRAFALAPHDAVRFNVAVCLERLGRFREATAEYDAASASEELEEASRTEARALAERTRARLGALVVEAEAPAEIEIAGVGCVAPCRLELDPGRYAMTVRGADDERVDVEIVRGEETTHRIDASARGASIDGGWSAFGVLLGVGSGLVALGVAGIIGFGVATEDAYARYVGGMAMEDLAQEGERWRDLTNASIAIASAGAILIAIDLVLLALDPPRGEHARSRAVVRF
jgi:tetratricopeptide (TPR) repeat protein